MGWNYLSIPKLQRLHRYIVPRWRHDCLDIFFKNGGSATRWCFCKWQMSLLTQITPYYDGILPKGPYLPCVSMAGRALLAGYHRIYDSMLSTHNSNSYHCDSALVIKLIVSETKSVSSLAIFLTSFLFLTITFGKIKWRVSSSNCLHFPFSSLCSLWHFLC